MSLERLIMTNTEIMAQPAQETTSLAIKQSLCVCRLPDSDPKDHQTTTVTRWLCSGKAPSLTAQYARLFTVVVQLWDQHARLLALTVASM